MRGNLFSESWFKVADIHAGLISSVEVQKQYYRGELWYVLQDAFNQNYFRITPEAYTFIARLSSGKTVQDVWEECLEAHKEKAPSQDDVITLLSQLHAHNLLYFKNSPRNEFIFERNREKKRKELTARIFSIISIKIPLWNPDEWLSRIQPFINVLFSLKGVFLWLAVVSVGGKTIIENITEVYDQTQGILSQSNLIFIYLALAILKCFHELSHAMITKRFGGNVPTLGIMFLVFTPLPYMDATTSWFFQHRWQRVLVGSAGMISDIFFAAIAAVVWAHTGDGLVHSLAFNIMIVGSVSSLLFNGNPLIRFDAYYILSDLLEIPNLYMRSRQQWQFWLEKYLFRVEYGMNPAETGVEAAWLACYAVCSLVYRIFLSIAIILFVTDRFFALGVVLMAIFVIGGVLLPLKKFITYLASSPKLTKSRKRAVLISAAAGAAVFFIVGMYPVSYSIRAPGIIESEEYHKIYAETEGKLEKIFFANGDYVQKGDVIAVLSNYELELEVKEVKEGLYQTKIMKQKAILNSAADLKPVLEREKVLREQLEFLKRKEKELIILASNSGVFVAPDLETMRGRWLERQTRIGTLIADGGYKFCAIVSQPKAFNLFREENYSNEVKLYGCAEVSFVLTDILVIPYQRDELPSAALGWLGGGDISVSTDEKSGKKATEPFFEIQGALSMQEDQGPVALLHGRSGVLRLTLPPEPLAVQGVRAVKQTIQKRYKL
ncbi:MAG: biotin/lipoyl-binding protein [Syntrophales bacterium]|jgi:putative peptide zinc metalloprotease protein|nr:biotin/lipoyl-binding protein [Syntrophales bacterium]MDY0043073.1 biotin/lipoyl-binding protein [Syntrophales bacterium]